MGEGRMGKGRMGAGRIGEGGIGEDRVGDGCVGDDRIGEGRIRRVGIGEGRIGRVGVGRGLGLSGTRGTYPAATTENDSPNGRPLPAPAAGRTGGVRGRVADGRRALPPPNFAPQPVRRQASRRSSASRGRAREKTEPRPGWLDTVSRPPKPSAVWRAMVRPSPVPPTARDRAGSTR